MKIHGWRTKHELILCLVSTEEVIFMALVEHVARIIEVKKPMTIRIHKVEFVLGV